MDALAAQETSLRDQLTDVKAKNSKLSESIRSLQNEPSDADLATQLASFQKSVDGLNTRLARIKGDSKLVSKAGMDKAQTHFNEAFKQWSKRKRAATGMIDDMAGEEGDPKKVVVSAQTATQTERKQSEPTIVFGDKRSHLFSRCLLARVCFRSISASRQTKMRR